MTLAAPLQDLTALPASYARDALLRVELAGKLPALKAIRTAREDTLGMQFEGKKGEHFFRSSLVQTLFYGVFAAWVLWSRRQPAGSRTPYDWRLAVWELRVPVVQLLFQQVATPSTLGPLGLVEVLDWVATALNRVHRANFFEQFQQAHAVQHFYEPFLEAFDPQLRQQLGVWYTPPEVVHYMIERVDSVLRDELGLPDGLAAPNVYVLDPGTGTGSFLVAALRKIAATLKAKGEDALLGSDIKRIVMQPVFGFELLPAPFVVAHLQLGLLLQDLGTPLSELPMPDGSYERVAVYLTNSLTGWEPPTGPKQHLLFAQMEAERDAASRVKTQAPILVILGNPPYDGFAGVSPKKMGYWMRTSQA
jgi:N-6 DNA Methylase